MNDDTDIQNEIENQERFRQAKNGRGSVGNIYSVEKDREEIRKGNILYIPK